MSKKKRIKILYVCFEYLPFVRRDIEMLKKHFTVKFVKYQGIKYMPLFLLKFLKDVLWSDIIISRFVSTHSFFVVLFSKLFKRSVLLLLLVLTLQESLKLIMAF